MKSADKNLDGAMDFQEFDGFGDFELVFRRWPQMWKILKDDILAGMNASPLTRDDLKRCQVYLEPPLSYFFRYFTKQEVLIRLIHNFIFHEDLQFPGWILED